MRLALITEGPLAYDGKDYYFSEGEGYYIEKLAAHFDEICIHAFAYRPNDLYYRSVARHKFKAKNIRVVEMPLAHSNMGKFGQLLRAASIIWSSMKKQDAFYIFMPGYTGAMGLSSAVCAESLTCFIWQRIGKKVLIACSPLKAIKAMLCVGFIKYLPHGCKIRPFAVAAAL